MNDGELTWQVPQREWLQQKLSNAVTKVKDIYLFQTSESSTLLSKCRQLYTLEDEEFVYCSEMTKVRLGKEGVNAGA